MYMMCYECHPEWGRASSDSDLLFGWRRRLRNDRRRRARRCPIVKPSRNIFNDPIDTLDDVVSSHSAARHD